LAKAPAAPKAPAPTVLTVIVEVLFRAALSIWRFTPATPKAAAPILEFLPFATPSRARFVGAIVPVRALIGAERPLAALFRALFTAGIPLCDALTTVGIVLGTRFSSAMYLEVATVLLATCVEVYPSCLA